MEKKISSYQKLKNEIEERDNQIHELKTDILHIIRYPDSPADIQARTKHEMSFKMDDAIWFNEGTHLNKDQFQGFLDIASKNPEGEYEVKSKPNVKMTEDES